MIKRRSAIEPAIGHMKMDGRLVRISAIVTARSGIVTGDFGIVTEWTGAVTGEV
ncbi:hypothetical protein SAMN05880557_101300 [Pseudacidovorax sp. RU35E]|nr:hypothetical protein SAMN05880557_101300 [Pseudacidovorax sp. RU35E]